MDNLKFNTKIRFLFVIIVAILLNTHILFSKTIKIKLDKLPLATSPNFQKKCNFVIRDIAFYKNYLLVATWGNGLYVFKFLEKKNKLLIFLIKHFTENTGLNHNRINCIFVFKNIIYLGGFKGVNFLKNWEIFNLQVKDKKQNKLLHSPLHSVFVDEKNIYLGTTGNGLVIYNKLTHKISIFDKKTGLKSTWINAILPVKYKSVSGLLICTLYGLHILSNGKIQRIIEGPFTNFTNHAFILKNNIWIATLDEGLWHYNGKTWKSHTTSNGFPANTIFKLCYFQNRLYFGAKNCLGYLSNNKPVKELKGLSIRSLVSLNNRFLLAGTFNGKIFIRSASTGWKKLFDNGKLISSTLTF